MATSIYLLRAMPGKGSPRESHYANLHDLAMRQAQSR
jgi:hypothetical protein